MLDIVRQACVPVSSIHNSPSTFVDVVRAHAVNAPGTTAFIFLKSGETGDCALTFSDLDRRARSIAQRLSQDMEIGDRVALAFPSSLDFIVGFLGCMYAGLIAVPVSFPRKPREINKLGAIVANCNAQALLTNQSSHADLAGKLVGLPALSNLPIMVVEAICDGDEPKPDRLWVPPALNESSIAFLQYTSGSTGEPKGVAITHGNLMANQMMITNGFGAGSDCVVAGWLPFHHDMGLVGNILNPIYLGVPCILMSPMAFMQQPVRWLQAISTYRVTTSGGPNFAYDLCVRRVSAEQMQGLDLSSWRVAFSGAEPVRAETLQRFSEKFSCVGFSSTSLYPCYGLAEATLFVSGGQGIALKNVLADALEQDQVAPSDENGAAAGKILVSCGMPRGDQRIEIVNPESKLRCKDGVVGEVWLQGSNIAKGYWNNEAATAESFNACLADARSGAFLRTGDLGFLDGGRLFITGRRKDLIIIKGRNLYPYEIEDQIAASHEAFDGCIGAAFSLEMNGEEKLVVMHEVSRHHLNQADFCDIRMRAREAVAHGFEIHLHDLVLVRPGTVPRTSSGKVRRSHCLELYRQKKLPSLEANK